MFIYNIFDKAGRVTFLSLYENLLKFIWSTLFLKFLSLEISQCHIKGISTISFFVGDLYNYTLKDCEQLNQTSGSNSASRDQDMLF